MTRALATLEAATDYLAGLPPHERLEECSEAMLFLGRFADLRPPVAPAPLFVLDLVNYSRDLVEDPLPLAELLEAFQPEPGYGSVTGDLELGPAVRGLEAARARASARDNGLELRPGLAERIADTVVVTSSGTTGALNCALLAALLRDRDGPGAPRSEVVFNVPTYCLPDAFARLHGLRPRPVAGTRAQGFLPGLDALRAACGERTLACVLTYPTNPAQRSYPAADAEALRALIRHCRDAGVLLVVDTIFQDLRWGSPPVLEVLALADSAEQVCKVFSPSKDRAFACGYRIGYLLADRRLAPWLAKIESLGSNSSNTLSELWLALDCVFRRALLEGGLDLEGMRLLEGSYVCGYGARQLDAGELLATVERTGLFRRYCARVDAFMRRIDRGLERIWRWLARSRCFEVDPRPRYGNTLMVRVREPYAARGDEQHFLRTLVATHVASLVGSCFGLPPGEVWFRVVMAGSPAGAVIAALERLEAFLLAEAGEARAPLEFLEEARRPQAAGGECRAVELRRHEQARVDARLFFRARTWLDSPAGGDWLVGLAARDEVARLRRRGNSVSLRLSDAHLARVGADLERGLVPLVDSQHLAGRSYVVGFVDPNTTKALHVGHLRNVALGHGLAALLERSGARVIRQAYVGDVGRATCEALAELRRLGPAATPAGAGLKPDHFVGRCYAGYARRTAGDDARDPAGREATLVGDEADELLRAWAAGEADVRADWERLRGYALSGQAETLARLGVVMDRLDFESDALDDARELARQGVASGVFQPGEGGALIFASGLREFPTMVVVRADGFPTEHLRLIALFYRILAEEPESRFVALAGEEWRPAVGVTRRLMRRLRPSRLDEVLDQHFYGMVLVGGDKMKSSDGRATLLDALLDRLETLPATQELARLSGGRLAPAALVDVVLKTFFLARPRSASLEFSWEALCEREENPGWQVAEALCRCACAPDVAGDGGDPRSPAYRTAVLQAVELRHKVREAAEAQDPSPLVRALLQASRRALAHPQPAIARVQRGVLAALLACLGIRAL